MPNYYDELTVPIDYGNLTAHADYRNVTVPADYGNRIIYDTVTNRFEATQLNINPNGITYEYKPYGFVTEEMLNEFARKIFRIIEEHTPIDITEEEFMDIIEEGK